MNNWVVSFMLSFWASYLLGLFFFALELKRNWNAALWWCRNTHKILFTKSVSDDFNTLPSVRNSGTFQMLKPSTIKPDQSLRPVDGPFKRRLQWLTYIVRCMECLTPNQTVLGSSYIVHNLPVALSKITSSSSEITSKASFTLQAKWPNQNIWSEPS